MPDTLPHIDIGPAWINLNSFSTVPVGVTMTIQNTGSHVVVLRIQPTVPDADDYGELLYPYRKIKTATANSIIWARSYTKEKLSRLQVEISGGFIDPGLPGNLSQTSLQIQLGSAQHLPGVTLWLLVTNQTDASLAIDQLINFEAFSTGSVAGTSIESFAFIFNPDITGADQLISDSKAYLNDIDGTFTDITGNGIGFTLIENLNEALNPDKIRIAGGAVSFFESAQSVNSSSVNASLTLTKAYFVAPGDAIILAYENSALVDAGTEVVATSLLSGHLLTLDGSLELPPNNLTDGVDNLIDDLGNNLVEDE